MTTKYIQVNVRYDKTFDNGAVKKVTEPFLVDALSCTEAEARVTNELRAFISGEFTIPSVVVTKISDVFFDDRGDRFYKVKVNFITLDEKTATEKKNASFSLVQAASFAEALNKFLVAMAGTMVDYEIESIAETKIVDVFTYKPANG